MHESHRHNLLACFLQVVIYIIIEIIKMYHVLGETEIYFFCPFFNYSEVKMIKEEQVQMGFFIEQFT